MNQPSRLSMSLRTLLLLVTTLCIVTGVVVYLYEMRYGRNRDGHQYFSSLGIKVSVGDPCPEEFVFYVDGTCRNDGLVQTDTPDWLDRIAGVRLSYPPIRELNFRNKDVNHYEFRFDLTVVDNILKYAPEIESLELPHIPELWDAEDADDVDKMIDRLSELKQLRVLSFAQWPVTDQHIHKLRALKRLQVLQLGHSSRVTDHAFDEFLEMKSLRVLAIREGPTDEAAAAFHRQRPDVILRVRGTPYGDWSSLYMNRNKSRS